MRFIAKLFMITILCFTMALNYKVISFNGGIKTIWQGKENNINIDEVALMLDISDIYYYQNPFGNGFWFIAETNNNGLMLTTGTNSDLQMLQTTGLLLSKIKPQAVTVIPWWIYLIGILIILFFPKQKKHSS